MSRLAAYVRNAELRAAQQQTVTNKSQNGIVLSQTWGYVVGIAIAVLSAVTSFAQTVTPR